MARKNMYAKNYRKMVAQEIYAEIVKQGIDSAMMQVPEIAKISYFEVQKKLKIVQEIYHEFGTIEYYEKQAGLLKEYKNILQRSQAEWEQKFLYWSNEHSVKLEKLSF